MSIPQQPDFFTLKFMSLPLCSAFQNPELSKPAVDVYVEMHYCFLLCSFLVAQALSVVSFFPAHAAGFSVQSL